MTPRLFLIGACMFFWASPAHADLNAETTTPYKLQIVLHFAQHRNMTEVFRTKVAQDVRDSLQAALGDLALVEVVTDLNDPKLLKNLPDPKLLEELLDRGLQHALDSWKFLRDVKIHFVLIDFVQGQYEISARQYDGATGLASPVVRQAQTSDRLLVAREAALLVYRDFGLVGTILNLGEGKSPKVTVAIKGGALDAPLERWIQKDDVFAVAEIVGQSGAVQRSNRRPWTLLQVVELPKNGICVCRPLSRYEWPPPPTGGSQGLRCLKLGTTQGQLKLRLIGDDKQSTGLNGFQVSVGARGFDPPYEQKSTGQDGFVQMQQIYKNLAFVSISDGNQELARIPVEIVDDRTIVCTIKVQHDGERLGQFGIRRGSFLRRLDADRILVERLWNELQKEGAMTPDDWLKRANQGRAILQTELLALTTESEKLKNERTEMEKDPKIAKPDLPDLEAADQILQGLQDRRAKLDESIKEMHELIKSGKPELQDKWKADIRKAESMESQADYPQAIAIYERIQDEHVKSDGKEDPGLKKRLDDLRQLWGPKNQEQRKARELIYEEWPQCTTARKMKDKLEEVKHAFQVCKAEDDHLTTRKLFYVNQDHAAQLRKELDEHDWKLDNEDDRTLLELLKTLALELDSFSKEVTAFLPKGKAGK